MNTDQLAGFIIGGFVGTVSVIILVFYVFQVIADWKIFTKGGEKGWKCLIPVYNLYTQYKLTWNPMMAFPVVILLGFYGITQNYPDLAVLSFLGSLAGIIGGILNIIGLYKLSLSFGKGVGFTVGLFFLAPIFFMILGFGPAQYLGNTHSQAIRR